MRFSWDFPVSIMYTSASTPLPMHFLCLNAFLFPSYKPFPLFKICINLILSRYLVYLLHHILISSFLWKTVHSKLQAVFIIINSQASYLCDWICSNLGSCHDTSKQNLILGPISWKQIQFYKSLINMQILLMIVLRNRGKGYIWQKSI